MSQYQIIPGNYGKALLLKQEWSDDLYEVIKKEKIEELHFVSSLGESANFSFLSKVKDLKGFVILDHTVTDISAVNELHNLRVLGVNTYCKTKIDFSNFPLLEECSITWRNGVDNIGSATKLKKLNLYSYSGNDLREFEMLIDLENIWISKANLTSLTGIEKLKKLKKISLAYCKLLTSLKEIEHLNNLEELEIDNCKKLSSIDEIKTLIHLKKLYINNCGEIESIKPLVSLLNLEEFLFWESTNVLDGDLSVLLKLPKLQKIAFQERRHYSHKRDQLK